MNIPRNTIIVYTKLVESSGCFNYQLQNRPRRRVDLDGRSRRFRKFVGGFIILSGSRMVKIVFWRSWQVHFLSGTIDALNFQSPSFWRMIRGVLDELSFPRSYAFLGYFLNRGIFLLLNNFSNSVRNIRYFIT